MLRLLVLFVCIGIYQKSVCLKQRRASLLWASISAIFAKSGDRIFGSIKDIQCSQDREVADML